MPEISAEAQALIDRLACMDPARPRSDKATIEQAIALHLAALELAERPCVWAEDALASYRLVDSRGEGREDAALNGKMRVRMAADGAASQTPAWEAGIYAQAATTDVGRYWARFAAEKEVRHAAQVSGFDMDTYRGIAFAGGDAIEAVSFVSRHAALIHPATAKAASAWLPLFDAFEAGLFLYWVTSTDVVCVLQPALSIVNGRLHRVAGPALEWPFGGSIHLRHGLVLPDRTKIRLEAQVLLARLASMDTASPSMDKATVERALTGYLEMLGLPSRPIVWADDAQAGYRHVSAAWKARGAAWKAARSANWHATAWDAAVYETEENLNRDVPEQAVWKERSAGAIAAGHFSRSDVWDSISKSAHLAAGIAGLLLNARIEGSATIYEGAVEEGHSAARSADRAVAYANMRAALPHPTTERLARSSLTLFEAFEAGLSLYWITPDEVVCVPQPSLSLEDGWLHRSDGPAVRWQTGEAYCFWWGTPIPAWAIAQPERLSVAAIHAEQDLDVRRALIEIYGLQRYFDDTKARRVCADDHCRLWEVSAGDETWRVVEAENGPSLRPRPRTALWNRMRWIEPVPEVSYTVRLRPRQ